MMMSLIMMMKTSMMSLISCFNAKEIHSNESGAVSAALIHVDAKILDQGGDIQFTPEPVAEYLINLAGITAGS